MKITWFGGTTFRLQIGGGIVVVDPHGAPAGIDPRELVSGADRTLGIADAETAGGLETLDPSDWRPRRAARVIDEDAEGGPAVEARRLSGGAVLVEGGGEAAVLAAADAGPVEWGRWTEGTVVVLAGDAPSCADAAHSLLVAGRPRLLALALSEDAADPVLADLAGALGSTSLQVLEPGLAVEV